MHRLYVILLIAGDLLSGGAPAIAQLLPQVPNLENRIPAPLPPPAQPPIINGPLSQGAVPPAIAEPPNLNTFSDRATGCVAQGGSAGLSGGELDAYTRECANDN